jgi:hypothetical protein
MELLIENQNYPVYDILKSINLFKLIFFVNEEILSDFYKDKINSNEINVNFNFKQLKKLKMEKYYLDLDIKKEENDDNIKFILTNSDDDVENVQFNKFLFDIITLDEDKYKLLINYEINDELYEKQNIRIFGKIIKKIFKNLQIYLNKLN